MSRRCQRRRRGVAVKGCRGPLCPAPRYGGRWSGWNRALRSTLFFFQAEDGIRDYKVTGVQTCALPIWLTAKVSDLLVPGNMGAWHEVRDRLNRLVGGWAAYFSYGTRLMAYRAVDKIGRASCRERV